MDTGFHATRDSVRDVINCCSYSPDSRLASAGVASTLAPAALRQPPEQLQPHLHLRRPTPAMQQLALEALEDRFGDTLSQLGPTGLMLLRMPCRRQISAKTADPYRAPLSV